jgi:putative ABC transport system permease protein
MSGFLPRRGARRALPSRLELEVREEIRFYLEMRARELQAEGRSAEEAWKEAVEAFGDPDAVAAAAVREGDDDEGKGGVMQIVDSVVQDVGYAVRSLKKTKGFTAVTVLTLALGIGATAAVYSVVNGVLLRPLPFDEPENLVAIWSRWVPESGYDWPQYPVGSPEYFDYLAQNRTMANVAAVSTERVSLRSGEGDPEMVTAGAVSPSMFPTLRVPPLLGRTLIEADGGAEPAPVAVLSHDFWQRRFGGDSTVVGRTLRLGWESEGNEAGSTVVGVMPAGFAYPDPDVDLWVPLLLDPARVWREGHWFSMIGRLAEGESLETAQADMADIMLRWRDDYPDHHRGHFLYMTPLLDDVVAGVRPTLTLLLGAVAFVLLIACANVASLLLARGQHRSRELAVRRALGAGRGRLVRQLLTEAAVLSLLGGALGVLLSVVGVDALLALEGGELPRLDEVGLNGGVLGFAGAVIVLTTLVFGLVPAQVAARANLTRAFTDGGGRAGSSTSRLMVRRGLVVGEITLAVLLVLGAGLMAKSLWRTLTLDPGFQVENVLTTMITFPVAGYTPEEKHGFMAALVERLEAHPGVERAGVGGRPPLMFDGSWTRFTIEGAPQPQEGEEAPTGSHVMAGETLFGALGISLVRGRLFDATDGPETPYVMLIDETMATRYWPGEDPLGRRIRLGDDQDPFATIVGIVTPARFDGLTKQAPTFYQLDRQAARHHSFLLGTMTLFTRTKGDPLGVTGAVRDAVRSLDPDLPILNMEPMAEIVGHAVAGPRFIMTLLAAFAGLALLMGCIGIYGVMSQAVEQRTGEIGIRRALGAGVGRVVQMILRQGLLVAGTGIALGIGAGFLLNRVLEGFLYEVTGTDPATYVLVGAAVAAISLLAVLVPARRASRVDPMEALRTD